jgi:TusA-related sulfurtransferase
VTRYAVEGAQLVIDALGRRCPVPVIELARHLRDVDIGEVVAVLADDAAARVDVPAWCGMRGQEYVGAVDLDDGRCSAYLVRRLS